MNYRLALPSPVAGAVQVLRQGLDARACMEKEDFVRLLQRDSGGGGADVDAGDKSADTHAGADAAVQKEADAEVEKEADAEVEKEADADADEEE